MSRHPMTRKQDPRSIAADATPDGVVEEKKRMDVRELLGEERELILIHAGEQYRLRITANGKLILTK